jgi:hypothetical protein
MLDDYELNICKLKLLENRHGLKNGSSHPYIKDIFIDKKESYGLIFCKIYSGPFKYIFICNFKNKHVKIDINCKLVDNFHGYHDCVNLDFGDCCYHLVSLYDIKYYIDDLENIFKSKWQNINNIKTELNIILKLNESESLKTYEKFKNYPDFNEFF